MTFSVQCLFLKMQWVGMQFMIVIFPGHTHCFIQASLCKIQGNFMDFLKDYTTVFKVYRLLIYILKLR